MPYPSHKLQLCTSRLASWELPLPWTNGVALIWLSVPPNTVVSVSLLHQRTVLWETRPPNGPQLPSESCCSHFAP